MYFKLLSAVTIDPNLIKDVGQALLEASDRFRAVAWGGIRFAETEDLEVIKSKKKLINGFLAFLEDLKEDLKRYSEVLDEIKKKEDELRLLDLDIAKNPLSKDAEEARMDKAVLLLSMINLVDELGEHARKCEAALNECITKQKNIAESDLFNPKQKESLLSRNRKEIN